MQTIFFGMIGFFPEYFKPFMSGVPESAGGGFSKWPLSKHGELP